jgi:ABC-type multidrug transport system fused ATPase/permease subunit
VWLRYRPELPPVLRGLTARIAPGMKVGIVGRTGAGKSTILMALLRLVEPERHPLPPALRASVRGSTAEDGGDEGYAAVAAASATTATAQSPPAPGACGVSIDGVDLASVPLTRLRRSVSVIPQDPVLYSGSVRFNCDPFDQHADADVVTALQRVQLWETHLAPHGGLAYPVKEGGANLSVGARQLVCLARAILRHSRVILLDECSANIDQDSDAAIQATIRTAFADATIITVAHRLATVIDSSAILLLDGGRAAEFDHPHALLQRGEGHFWELVQETGPASAAQLSAVAAKAWAETYGGRTEAAGNA